MTARSHSRSAKRKKKRLARLDRGTARIKAKRRTPPNTEEPDQR